GKAFDQLPALFNVDQRQERFFVLHEEEAILMEKRGRGNPLLGRNRIYFIQDPVSNVSRAFRILQ
ncbi:MAG: hypothetical protein O7F09_00165, partial [Chloroflexi bacterium]|nr:hypothetical protein [Chloroflexota bacterium]